LFLLFSDVGDCGERLHCQKEKYTDANSAKVIILNIPCYFINIDDIFVNTFFEIFRVRSFFNPNYQRVDDSNMVSNLD